MLDLAPLVHIAQVNASTPETASLDVWQSTLLAAIVGAIVGGGLAVLANFLGNRYLHHLQIRDAHRDDLDNVILRPWISHIETLRSETDTWTIRVWPHATHHGWRTRGNEYLESKVFEPTSPLWDAVEQHWPEPRKKFRDLQDRFKTAERSVTDLLGKLRAEIDALPLVWEPDDATRKSRRAELNDQNERARARGQGARPLPDFLVGWSDDQADAPKFGLNKAMVAVWAALVERRHLGKPIVLEQDERRDETGLYLAHQGEIARGGRDAIALVKSTLDRVCQDPQLQKEFEKIIDEASETQKLADSLLFDVRRLSHDRKLSGGCDYCPRYLR